MHVYDKCAARVAVVDHSLLVETCHFTLSSGLGLSSLQPGCYIGRIGLLSRGHSILVGQGGGQLQDED